MDGEPSYYIVLISNWLYNLIKESTSLIIALFKIILCGIIYLWLFVYFPLCSPYMYTNVVSIVVLFVTLWFISLVAESKFLIMDQIWKIDRKM